MYIVYRQLVQHVRLKAVLFHIENILYKKESYDIMKYLCQDLLFFVVMGQLGKGNLLQTRLVYLTIIIVSSQEYVISRVQQEFIGTIDLQIGPNEKL